MWKLKQISEDGHPSELCGASVKLAPSTRLIYRLIGRSRATVNFSIIAEDSSFSCNSCRSSGRGSSWDVLGSRVRVLGSQPQRANSRKYVHQVYLPRKEYTAPGDLYFSETRLTTPTCTHTRPTSPECLASHGVTALAQRVPPEQPRPDRVIAPARGNFPTADRGARPARDGWPGMPAATVRRKNSDASG